MKGLVFAVLLAGASFGGPFAAWPLVAAVSADVGDQARYVRITLEPAADVTPGLRIVDEHGTETPYVVDPDLHRVTAGGNPVTPPGPDSYVERSAPAQTLPQSAASPDQAWTFDLGRTAPASGVRFDGGQGTFANPVVVEGSADGKNWHPVANGSIARSPQATQLTFAFTQNEDRYWRVTLKSGGHTVDGIAPKLLVQPHDVLFEALPGHSYSVLVGNTSAPGPIYDLGSRLEREEWTDVRGTLGAFEANGAYEDSRPIFDRYPWLPNAAFGLAILLGLVVVVLRRFRPPPEDPVAGTV